MGRCKTCKDPIPNRLSVNGRVRTHLGRNRQRCLKCSPYKLQTPRQRVCDICNGNNRCQRCRLRFLRQKKKLQCIDYLGGECQECGYNKHPAALEFHHRDPEHKSFGISAGLDKTFVELKKELDKCDLLCSNCHAELTCCDQFTAEELRSPAIRTKRDTTKKHLRQRAQKPNKEWLSQLLWLLPSSDIAEIYGVSDKSICKWASSYGLEKPPRGWWAIQNRKYLPITIPV